VKKFRASFPARDASPTASDELEGRWKLKKTQNIPSDTKLKLRSEPEQQKGSEFKSKHPERRKLKR
jgi:hypothetical protein